MLLKRQLTDKEMALRTAQEQLASLEVIQVGRLCGVRTALSTVHTQNIVYLS